MVWYGGEKGAYARQGSCYFITISNGNYTQDSLQITKTNKNKMRVFKCTFLKLTWFFFKKGGRKQLPATMKWPINEELRYHHCEMNKAMLIWCSFYVNL